MYSIVSNFIEQLLNDFFANLMGQLRDMLGSLFKCAFLVETLPGLDTTVLNTAIVQNMVTGLYAFMVLLLALKLIWKGWNVYVLWRDGESETPPGEMVVGAVYAMVTAVAFPIVYEMAVSVVMEIASTVLRYTGWAEYDLDGSFGSIDLVIDLISTIGRNAVSSIMLLVFIIVLIILIFKLLMKGVELLIWRLGVPIAVVGLVNSDGGAWKAYAQVFLKELATVLAQYFCLIMGILVASGGSFTGLALGIAFEITGISAPKLLSQFMSPSGGGGGLTQKIYTVSLVMRAFGA